MKTGRGRRVARVTAAVGLVVLAATGYALRDRIREEYWLYRLENGDRPWRESAARALASMRSLRSAPHLVRAIQRESGEGAVRHGPESFGFTPLVAALHAIGPSARPAVRDQIRTLAASGGLFEFVALAWETPGCTVREITVQDLGETRSVPFVIQIHPEF